MKVLTVLKWALVSYLVIFGYMLMYIFTFMLMFAIPLFVIWLCS